MSQINPIGGGVPQWTLADRLRKARDSSGMSQEQLADAIDISRRSATKYERGLAEPKRHVILSWAMATGVDPVWLREGIDLTNYPDDPAGLGERPTKWLTVAPAAA